MNATKTKADTQEKTNAGQLVLEEEFYDYVDHTSFNVPTTQPDIPDRIGGQEGYIPRPTNDPNKT